MTTRRYFSNNAPQQTLNAPILSGATTLVVAGSFSGWPTQFPFFAELDFGTASAEIITVTGISGTTATIVRGQGGTSAISHTAGATLDHVAVAQDLDEANAHTSANSGVHGISGNVVGTSDAQTLSNKTIATPTVTGTLTATGAVTVTGNISSGGNASVTGSVSAASAAISGSLTAASVAANGDGLVSGVVVPKTYNTEAAATAAQPSPALGTVVFLYSPANYSNAGLYYWAGSAWVPLNAGGYDTGWVNMSGVASGWTVIDQPQSRRYGKWVVCRGTLQNSSFSTGTFTDVLSLDTSMPVVPVASTWAVGGSVQNRAVSMPVGTRKIQINTSGATAAYYSLAVISYLVD